MSLDKLFLILVIVVAGTGALVGSAMFLLIGLQSHPLVLLGVVLGIGLLAYIAWRLIAERVGNKEDDHYDGMTH